MAIVRVRKDSRYFTASNEVFVDASISWEARGLMGYLLSKPDRWEVRITDLQKQGPAGEDKLRRMLAELRLHGYMNRIRITGPDGKFSWVTEVFESPSQNLRKTTSGFSTSGSTTSGKPADIVITEVGNTDSESGTPEKAPLTQEELDEANRLLDAILANMARKTYEHREKFPEVLLPYCDLYVSMTGQTPRKKVLTDWLATFSDWQGAGLTLNHIATAIRTATYNVVRPGSLTNSAVAIKGKEDVLRSGVGDPSRRKVVAPADFK